MTEHASEGQRGGTWGLEKRRPSGAVARLHGSRRLDQGCAGRVARVCSRELA